MNGLRAAFKFYINASVHVALAVSSLIFVTSFELDSDSNLFLVGFIFFGTITGYNFVKFAPAAGMHHRSLTNSLKAIQVFSFVSTLLAMFCLFHLPRNVWLVSGVFGVLTVFYAPFIEKRNLRGLSGLKIYVVALVWAGVTVLIPWSMDQDQLVLNVGILFLQVFLCVIVWTLPFEIRDLKYDPDNLKTLPQRLGVKKTKGLGIAFLVLVIMLEGLKEELKMNFFISLFATVFLSGFLLLRSKRDQSAFFASFWVEAIPIIWCILLFSLQSYR